MLFLARRQLKKKSKVNFPSSPPLSRVWFLEKCFFFLSCTYIHTYTYTHTYMYMYTHARARVVSLLNLTIPLSLRLLHSWRKASVVRIECTLNCPDLIYSVIYEKRFDKFEKLTWKKYHYDSAFYYIFLLSNWIILQGYGVPWITSALSEARVHGVSWKLAETCKILRL